jgi:hypothetical protein
MRRLPFVRWQLVRWQLVRWGKRQMVGYCMLAIFI